jgi:hypothetical protein
VALQYQSMPFLMFPAPSLMVDPCCEHDQG